jgi:HSP20 family protein
MMRRNYMTPYEGSMKLNISDLFEGLANVVKLFEENSLTSSTLFGGENVNVYVDNEGYHIEMAIPGVSKDDIDVELVNDTIKVKVDKKIEEEKQDRNYVIKEFSIEKIEREFKIPEGFDLQKIDVKYENGILKFDIPVIKKVEQNNIKKIEIK